MSKTFTIPTDEVTQWNLILPDEMLEAVANRFKLLSEPMRLKILRSLCDRERTVQEIVNTINANQANVSKHLALMYDNGMVTRRKDGLKCYYRITDDSTVFTCYLTSKSVVENLQHRLNQVQNFKSTLHEAPAPTA